MYDGVLRACDNTHIIDSISSNVTSRVSSAIPASLAELPLHARLCTDNRQLERHGTRISTNNRFQLEIAECAELLCRSVQAKRT